LLQKVSGLDLGQEHLDQLLQAGPIQFVNSSGSAAMITGPATTKDMSATASLP